MIVLHNIQFFHINEKKIEIKKIEIKNIRMVFHISFY